VIVPPEFRRSPLATGVMLTVAGFQAEGRIWQAERQNFRGSVPRSALHHCTS